MLMNQENYIKTVRYKVEDQLLHDNKYSALGEEILDCLSWLQEEVEELEEENYELQCEIATM